ncbi:S-layer protein [Cytobacillus firmus]|uniref:S-layer protein n=1 Tax=Cytobacillus firmus TaxID=1399 RepID=UPI00222838F7|nr:S-layer protein [Cytobacillus firmus]
MAKKKAIKLAAASAVAASAFVAAAPAQTDAASNVAVEVSKAVTQMKKAYHTYSDVTSQGKFAPIADVYKEYNAAKAAYKNAKALVTKAGGEHKEAYLAQLDATYNEYIAKRVITYIDAFNYATALEDKKEALEAALEEKEWDKAEDLFHEISYELNTRTVILHRVYGKTARELLVEAFKQEAQDLRDSITNEVSVKMYYDKAEDLVAEGKLEDAKKAMDHVADYVAKLDKDTDFGAALLTKVSEVKAAYEAKLAPAVESVSAINGKELQITFNKAIDKATVIGDGTGTPTVDADGTLKDGVFKFNNVDGKDLKASLSKDGKVLTVVSASTWEGNLAVEVKADSIKGLDGKFASAFLKAFDLGEDTTRATVTGVNYVSKYVHEITFSEPLASEGAVTYSYADGSTTAIAASGVLSGDGKTYTVTFTSVLPNKEVNVNFAALEDGAGNKSVPTTAKITVSDADKTKPVVSSVTNTGYNGTATSFQIKLSEPVAANATVTGITVAGVATTTASVDAKDNTIINATVAGKISGSQLVHIAADTFIDLNGNGNAEVGQFYNFSIDTAAPTVVGQSVERVNGLEYLVLTFNEDIEIGAAPAAVAFKSVDKFGMEQTTTDGTPTIAKFNVVNGKSKQLSVALDALEDNTAYKVSFAEGLVKDGYNNVSAALNNVAFTTSTVNTGVGTSNVATIDATPATPGKITVTFTKPVNVASAQNVANYTVEGATVSKATVTANSSAGATVVLTLADNTVETSGYYNVTVGAITPFNSLDSANAAKTAASYLKENVRSVVKSKVLTSLTAETFGLNVTFDDATVASSAGTANDFELYVDGKATGVKLDVNAASGSATISYDDTVAGAVKDFTTATSIKLVALDTIDIKDTTGNVVNVSEIVIK